MQIEHMNTLKHWEYSHMCTYTYIHTHTLINLTNFTPLK